MNEGLPSIGELKWGMSAAEKNRQLVRALEITFSTISSVVQRFASLDEFVAELKKLEVISCGKVHENPENDVTQQNCSISRFNLSCAHDSYYLLKEGLMLAKAFGKISADEAQEFTNTLIDVQAELYKVDVGANYFYQDKGGSLEEVKAAEQALGEQKRQIRDEIVKALLS